LPATSLPTTTSPVTSSPPLPTASISVDPAGFAPVAKGNPEGLTTPSWSVGAERSSVDSGTLLSSLSSYLETLARSLIDGVLNLLGGLLDALNQGLQSLPAGAIPAPAGSGLSGGSASSSFSGSGLDRGLSEYAILALLAILLLSGKFSWSVPEYLRPNSALRLAIERPG
jgi:hypothetical protein